MNCLSLGSVGLALLLAWGCAPSVASSDCNDGLDNDNDQLIDDVDPGCAASEGNAEFPDPTQCSNDRDDDGDALVDLADHGCEDAADDEEEDPTRACNDGVDNDEDEVADFPADTGCESPVDDDEFNPALCGDLEDNDQDGRIDWPFDPGCDSTEDPSEEDPPEARECSDAKDNDGDELIDFGQDPGCGDAADSSEFNDTGECGPGVQIVDITSIGMATDSVMGPLPNELTSPVCEGYGGEFAYVFQTDVAGTLKVSTDYPDTTLDTIVYVRTECRRQDTELACNDDRVPPGASVLGSRLSVPVQAGHYYVIVDTFGPGSQGNFKLTVELQ